MGTWQAEHYLSKRRLKKPQNPSPGSQHLPRLGSRMLRAAQPGRRRWSLRTHPAPGEPLLCCTSGEAGGVPGSAVPTTNGLVLSQCQPCSGQLSAQMDEPPCVYRVQGPGCWVSVPAVPGFTTCKDEQAVCARRVPRTHRCSHPSHCSGSLITPKLPWSQLLGETPNHPPAFGAGGPQRATAIPEQPPAATGTWA